MFRPYGRQQACHYKNVQKKVELYRERVLRGKQGKGSLELLTPKQFLLTPASSQVIRLYTRILSHDV
jgi:hypothetical protein